MENNCLTRLKWILRMNIQSNPNSYAGLDFRPAAAFKSTRIQLLIAQAGFKDRKVDMLHTQPLMCVPLFCLDSDESRIQNYKQHAVAHSGLNQDLMIPDKDGFEVSFSFHSICLGDKVWHSLVVATNLLEVSWITHGIRLWSLCCKTQLEGPTCISLPGGGKCIVSHALLRQDPPKQLSFILMSCRPVEQQLARGWWSLKKQSHQGKKKKKVTSVFSNGVVWFTSSSFADTCSNKSVKNCVVKGVAHRVEPIENHQPQLCCIFVSFQRNFFSFWFFSRCSRQLSSVGKTQVIWDIICNLDFSDLYRYLFHTLHQHVSFCNP